MHLESLILYSVILIIGYLELRPYGYQACIYWILYTEKLANGLLNYQFVNHLIFQSQLGRGRDQKEGFTIHQLCYQRDWAEQYLNQLEEHPVTPQD